jgi:tetratricopeptide (TPR) repeat protein
MGYNRPMHAELAYLFRHAVLRDAAYLLLVPQDRAALHWLAVSVLQTVLHPTEQDAAGFDLAEHARMSLPAARNESETREMLTLEHGFLTRAADYCKANGASLDEARLRDRLAAHDLSSRSQKAASKLRAAECLIRADLLDDANERAEAALRDAAQLGDRLLDAHAQLVLLDIRRITASPEGRDCDIDALLANTAADPELHLMALNELRRMHETARRDEQAMQVARDAAAYALDHGKQEWASHMLGYQAYELHALGDTARAIEILQQAAALGRECGSELTEAQSWNTLGIVRVESGDIAGADAAYRQALALARSHGAKSLENSVLTNLGNLDLYFRGNLAQAEANYLASMNYCLETGHRASLAVTYVRLIDVYLARHEFRPALQFIDRMCAIAPDIPDMGLLAKGNIQRSRVEVELSLDQRLEALVLAMHQATEFHVPRLLPEAWFRMAELLCQGGLYEAGREAAQRVEALSPGGALEWHARAAATRCLIMSGMLEEAAAAVDWLLTNRGRTTTAHFVSSALKGKASLAALRALGPVGAKPPTPELLSSLQDTLATMHKAVANTGFKDLPAVRNAKAQVEQLMEACTSPAQAVVMGVPIEAMPPQQLASCLQRQGPQDAERLRQAAARDGRLSVILGRAQAWLNPRGALRDVPGVAPLLAGNAS